MLLPLSRDKGTAGQAKIFCPGTKGHRDRSSFIVPGQRDNGTSSKSCYGQDRIATQNPERDIGWDGVLIFCHRGRLGPYFDSLYPPGTSQDKGNLKECFFFTFFFVLGGPGTEEFVPDFFLLLLSRDRGMAGQGNFFCTWTKGQRDVPSLGNASMDIADTCL